MDGINETTFAVLKDGSDFADTEVAITVAAAVAKELVVIKLD